MKWHPTTRLAISAGPSLKDGLKPKGTGSKFGVGGNGVDGDGELDGEAWGAAPLPGTEATHEAVVRNLQKHAAAAQRGGGQHTLVHGPPGRDWQILLATS